MVEFVANLQAFRIGGLREVPGRSQPGTVGLLRREQPLASASKDGRVISRSDLRQNVEREARREGIARYAFFPPPRAVAVPGIEQLLTQFRCLLGRPELTLKPEPHRQPFAIIGIRRLLPLIRNGFLNRRRSLRIRVVVRGPCPAWPPRG